MLTSLLKTIVSGAINTMYGTAIQVRDALSYGTLETTDLLKTSDIKEKIKITNMIIYDIRENGKCIIPGVTAKYIIEKIENIISCIENELDKINYRLEYNKNISLLSYPIAYRFHNQIRRLNMLIAVLDQRVETLHMILKLT